MADQTKAPSDQCHDQVPPSVPERKKPEEQPRVHGKPESEKIEAQQDEPLPSKGK